MSVRFRSFLTDPALIKQFILDFGPTAPIVFIGVQVLQVIFPIIPGQLVIVIAGALFGPIKGMLCCLIGLSIGISSIFLMSRRFGRQMIKKWIGQSELDKFNDFFDTHGGIYAIFIARIVPLFPNDVLSFGAGLTNIKFKKYFIASMLGFIPGVLILTLVGSQLSFGLNPKTLLITFLTIGMFVLIYKFKHQIKVSLHKNLIKIEKMFVKS
ncbi:MAG: TVP38/TMEM64 family protein [Nanoarchaeota archaeon]